jgi:uncharacterized repeat protein (TIGR03803 family)
MKPADDREEVLFREALQWARGLKRVPVGELIQNERAQSMKMNIAILNRPGRWFGNGYMMTPNNLFRHLAGSLPGVLLLCLLAANGRAQVFTTLHNFTATSGTIYGVGTNSDGYRVFRGLLLSGNTLYGAAIRGGSGGCGTIFAVNANGTGFTTLHSFTATFVINHGNYDSTGTNSDGAFPNGGLILSGNTLYGTAQCGASAGWGTVFALNTDGTGFTNLHNFTATSGSAGGGSGTNSDGAYPFDGLLLSGNTLYGTAQCGGSSGWGTVFALNTDGTGFTNLHTFSATTGSVGGDGINSDGANPLGGLILSGSSLYGTAVQGGTAGYGTVFSFNTDGTGFRTLHSFTDGSDGGYPWDALILSGNTLYGTAEVGGSSGWGTVFAVNTNGTGFRNLHSFTGGSGGADPRAGLILSGNTLYGTAFYSSASSGNGIVFAVNTNGTGFTILHAFAVPPNQEGNPAPELVLSGTTLFGASFADGAYGHGTVFSLSYPSPRLTIMPSGTNVNLTWPSAVAGFSYSAYTLQSTTNLGSSAVWATNSPAPVVVNGQNVVTNSITGSQQFYRLSQ